MKRILFTIIFFVFKLVALGQAIATIDILKQALLTNKIAISTSDISKTLSDPLYWELMGTYQAGEISTTGVNKEFWFSKDGLYAEMITSTKLFSSVFEQEVNSGFWHYDKIMKTLSVNFFDKVDIYTLITLNDTAIVIADKTGTRFLLFPHLHWNDPPTL